MTFYCPIGQEMLNLVTTFCKLLKSTIVYLTPERAISSAVEHDIKTSNNPNKYT